MTCNDCKLDKPESAFSKDSATRTGLRRYCRECAATLYKRDYASRPDYHKKRSSDWAKKNPEKRKLIQKNADLMQLYGISLVDYEARKASQGGQCKICGGPLSPGCVDHCHATGRIRGILCTGCNTGIGGLKDSIPNLLSAIAYLKSGTDGGRGG
jgi:hypothetical protein